MRLELSLYLDNREIVQERDEDGRMNDGNERRGGKDNNSNTVDTEEATTTRTRIACLQPVKRSV